MVESVFTEIGPDSWEEAGGTGSKMAFDRTCIFCKIIAGEIEASIVYQDERVTAFMDLYPATAGHVLVVPNHHAQSITDVDPDSLGQMFVVGADLDSAIRHSGLRCDAVSFYLADGEAAGQVVQHAHLHVIPRYPGDTCGLRLHAGPVELAQRAELEAHADSIRKSLEG